MRQQLIKRFRLFLLSLAVAFCLSIGSIAIAQNSESNSNIIDATNSNFSIYPKLERQQIGLIGRAVLPADTFFPGPASGQLLTPGLDVNNKPVPFNSQPIQGFSAILLNRDGSYNLMVDNGFGAKNNSADSLLVFYKLRPDFKTTTGGSGTVSVLEAVRLNDPNRKAGFTITADLSAYPKDTSTNTFPGPLTNIPVDPAIKSRRLLTGMDFDPESFRRVPDGTFWFGEEFGPFLLHTDAKGKLLETPYSVPIPSQLKQYGRGVDVFRSPQNPAFFNLANDTERQKVANVFRSKGFEGMALSSDGTKLYPLLEGPMIEDPNQSRLVIAEFDIRRKRFTGQFYFYKLDVPYSSPAPNRHKIGDMTAVNNHEFLVIETDDGQGATAAFKKVYKIDIRRVDSQGFVSKQEVVDLLNIANPSNLAADAPSGSFGTGNPFKFPFLTIEAVQVIDSKTILIANDNNYPTTGGNGRRTNDTDDNELILVRIDQPLKVTTKK